MISLSNRALTVGSLFSGIGGLDLGLEWAGMETSWFCEIEPFAQEVLKRHWPGKTIISDIRDINEEATAEGLISPVDIIAGGFPCQPFSAASHGVRVAVDLWPEMLRLCNAFRPTYIIAENVAEAPIRKALADIAAIGYRGEAFPLSAGDAGADHQRSRWWLCAYSNNESQFYQPFYAKVAQLPKVCRGVWGRANYARAVRVSDGLPNRMDRIKALGNAVVPQVAYLVGRAVMAHAAESTKPRYR